MSTEQFTEYFKVLIVHDSNEQSVGVTGFEPASPEGNGFTVRRASQLLNTPIFHRQALSTYQVEWYFSTRCYPRAY
jgi:hypothetical protein